MFFEALHGQPSSDSTILLAIDSDLPEAGSCYGPSVISTLNCCFPMPARTA